MISSSENGFIALIAAIIISAVLLVMTVSGGMASIFSRGNIFDTISKSESERAADACASAALVHLAENDLLYFSPLPQSITLNDDVCTITSFSPDTPEVGQITITVESTVAHAATTEQVIFNTNTQAILSWEELP